jgi:hypothetical protein
MRAVRAVRMVAGGAGVAAMVLGAWLLLTDRQVKAPLAVLGWLVGAVVLHDGVLVPVVLGIGALLPVRMRRPLRAALIVAACLTAVALPVLLRPGRPTNATVLPLNYPLGLLIALGAVATGTAGWWALRLLGRKRRP